MRQKMLPIITFARIDIQRLFRDKVGIFFVFFFPLMFLLVFGGLFGSDNDVNFDIKLFNNSDSEFAEQFVDQADKDEIFTLKNDDIDTREDAEEALKRGQISAIITLPEDFGEIDMEKGYPSGQAEIIYDKSNEQAGVTLGSIMDSIFAEINSGLVENETPFTSKLKASEVEGLSGLDYLFPGMLGFVLLTIGIFGPSTVFPRMKEKGILRRYHTTPIRVWQYFTGNVLSNMAVGLMSVAFMSVVAMMVFDVQIKGDYISLITMVLLGTTVMFGIGLAIGGWAKNENQAQPLANILSFPMMFLTGVFFPTFLMPEWLQMVSKALPLTPISDGLRLIITEGKTLLDLGPELGIIAIWGVVIYLIAFKVFRWE